MAFRGKKFSLKKWEVKVSDINIDLRHFAYRCFVHSALKFQVPEACICKWNEVNEYDKAVQRLCAVIFRSIFKHQIALRCTLYEMFKPLCESNDLKSFTKVKGLLQDALRQSIAVENLTIVDEAEISLAVTCELILFLYSKDSNLYLNELAKFWFEWFFPQKKKFEKSCAIDSMYFNSALEGDPATHSASVNMPKGADDFPIMRKLHERFDNLIDEFILDRCVPYQETLVESKQFVSLFLELGESRRIPMNTTFLQKEYHKREQEVRRNKPRRVEDSSRTSAPVPITKQGLGPGVGALENTGLGICPHEELLQCIGATASADATPPQTLVGTQPLEPPRRRRGSSGHQRRTRPTSSSHSGVAQDFRRLSLESSGTKQPSKEKPSVRVDDAATQSQRLLEAIPKKPAEEDGNSDSKEDSGACALENTGLGTRRYEEFFRGIGVSADATPSQTIVGTHRESQRLLGAIPKPAKEDSK